MDVDLRLREVSRQIIERHFPHELPYFDLVWEALRYAAIEDVDVDNRLLEEPNLGMAGSSRDWALPIIIRTLRCVSAQLPLSNAATFAEHHVTEIARKCAGKYGAPGYLIGHLAEEVFPLLYQWPYAPELVKPAEEIFEVVIRHPRAGRPKIVSKTVAEVDQMILRDTKHFDLFVNLSSRACPLYGGNAVAGVQERQKELLAYLLTHMDRSRTAEDIWDAVWSPHVEPCDGEGWQTKRERIEKQLRLLRHHFRVIHVDLEIEVFRGTYRFGGSQSFCVIPPKPTLKFSS